MSLIGLWSTIIKPQVQYFSQLEVKREGGAKYTSYCLIYFETNKAYILCLVFNRVHSLFSQNFWIINHFQPMNIKEKPKEPVGSSLQYRSLTENAHEKQDSY